MKKTLWRHVTSTEGLLNQKKEATLMYTHMTAKNIQQIEREQSSLKKHTDAILNALKNTFFFPELFATCRKLVFYCIIINAEMTYLFLYT